MSSSQLDATDLVVLVVAMISCAATGFYFTNKNKTLDSFMLGERKLSALPVSISLMTSYLTGLTLLGTSSEFYYQGPSFAFLAIPVLMCGPIAAYTILPVFHRMNQLSLYKMLFYNSVILYLPSMALESIFGIKRSYSILTIGLMCVCYSGIGGIKAVVWTDFLQAIFTYTAVILVAILGTRDAGGFTNVMSIAQSMGRLDMTGFFNLDLTTRHTFAGILLGSTIKQVYLVGVNQVQLQRALSLPTLKQSQLALIYCSIFASITISFLGYMGAVIVADYRSCDPYLAGDIRRRDAIIIHYVAHRLARVPGVRGLFVAGIFCTSMSTLSSFTNSMAALAIEEYLSIIKRFNCNIGKNLSQTHLARVLGLIFGVLCVLMAYGVENVSSRLYKTVLTVFGAVGVPILTAFMLGIYTRFTNTIGIVAGLIVTFSLGFYVAAYQTFFKSPLEPSMPVFYDEQCAKVFNLTLEPDQMHLPPEVTEWWAPGHNSLQPAYPPFQVTKISYMILTAIQFVVLILVSSLVSIMTGGWRQHVEDEYLAEIMHQKSYGATNHGCQADHFIKDNNCCSFDSALARELCNLSPRTRSSRNMTISGIINNGFDGTA